MTEKYSAENSWAMAFAGLGMSHPAEYVIRIFRGNYPNLRMSRPSQGQSILDVGCGDGRHLPLFSSLGLEPFGVEISLAAVALLRERLGPLGIPPDRLKAGSCAHLPFHDANFDYVIAWNSAYYMSLDDADFSVHADELVRVLRPGGWLILSVPKSTAFIFDKSIPSDREGCRVIQNDPFGGMRNGEVMRVFESRDELESAFSGSCDTFCHADIHDDCFGFAYHWHLLVTQKKST